MLQYFSMENSYGVLFAEHIKTLTGKMAGVMSECGYDVYFAHSGTPVYYHADDQEVPFHTVPHFRHWLPLAGPNHILVISPDKRPEIIRVTPEDFWYEQVKDDAPFWASEFNITDVASADDAWSILNERSINKKVAFVGDRPACERAEANGISKESCNPQILVKKLDELRTVKSDYEVACIEEANRKASGGFIKAYDTFLAGGSELDIHHAFLVGSSQAEVDLPYPAITALDEKSAVLHYQNKRHHLALTAPSANGAQRGIGEWSGRPKGPRTFANAPLCEVDNGYVCLLDAGASVNGYASDITRTWASPKCDGRFVAILEALNTLQQELCAMVKPGVHTLELHYEAHKGIASILHDVGGIKIAGDEAIKAGLTSPFFPHGLGHFLGIQVHDVGGSNTTEYDNKLAELFPKLRTLRKLEVGNVITIEPGIYFIPMLLRKLKESASSDMVNWDLVSSLTPLGGERIEDDILVTEKGQRNLTRHYFESLDR